MLTRNHRQEALSRAYIQAIAGACGLSTSFRDFDYGFDLTLHDIRRRGGRRSESGFKLDVQAKSTTQGDRTTDHLHYDLAVPNYDDLRDTSIGNCRILVVLVLPDKESAWLEQSDAHLLLRHAAYWTSLRGWPATSNRKTIQISIPCMNLFSPAALQAIMAKITRGELL